jgi:D-sedoheptulose 7-phosphate isomerase
MTLGQYLAESARILDLTGTSVDESVVSAAIESLICALRAGKPLLVCGNGGSESDAMHITGELVGRFLLERRALNVICLSSNPAVLTAWSNDYSFDTVFARQVEAYGQLGAVLLGISTSGNSQNILAAFETARSTGMVTVALTGEGGGKISAYANHLLAVPSQVTSLIQQAHICIYHYLCKCVEERMNASWA